MTIEQAAEMLGVQPGLLQPFAVADPFHDGLPLEGFLCHKTDHRYGAVVITRVGEQPCPQLIHATPKLRYPFDRDGRFRSPPIARAHVYEKLDGTNVLAHNYRDAAGVVRTTFKLRLHPVLRNGTFGGFLDLWRELLERHPEAVHCRSALQNRPPISTQNRPPLQGGVYVERIVFFGPDCKGIVSLWRMFRKCRRVLFVFCRSALWTVLRERRQRGCGAGSYVPGS
jgi:hypothetical protein